MKVTKLMGMAVVLVALAVTISALAYNTAAVTNSFSMTVANTGAALDVQPASGVDSGIQAMSANGYVNINMNDKIQPNATYVYDPVIAITNNAGADVKVWVDFSPALPTGMSVTFSDANGSLPSSAPGTANFTAATGNTRTFKMTVTTTSATPAGAVAPTMTIHGAK